MFTLCHNREASDAMCRMVRPALALASKGTPVFPCRPNKKPFTQHGFKEATTDRTIIIKWWLENPDANIGVPTGEHTGIVVLDIDMDENKDGEAALRKLTSIHGELPATREIMTPRGGRHICFRHPGQKVPSRQNHPAPALDVRADGGYVLVPPSRTDRGQYIHVNQMEPVECPPWLMKLMIDGVSSVDKVDVITVNFDEKFEHALVTAGVKATRQLPHTTSKGASLERWEITCPWSNEHTTGGNEACVFLDTEGNAGFRCHHAHCAKRKWKAFADKSGVKWDRRSITSASNGRTGGRPPFDADMATRDFLTGCGIELRHHHGRWMRFDSMGWKETSEDDLSAEVLTWLAGNQKWKPHAYSRSAREVVEHLKRFDLCGIPEHIEAPCWLVKKGEEWKATPCQNSMAFRRKNVTFEVVDIAEMARAIAEFRPFPDPKPADASFFSLEWASYGFDMEAQCPRFQAYLNDALDLPEQVLMSAFMGLALTNITKYEVFLYLYGRSGREGKTVWLEVLKALLGRPDAVSYVDIAKLSDKFAAWPLAHSKANIAGDTNSIEYGDLRKIEGVFKDLVSGGNFEYERKNEQKRTARCKARFIFAGNTLPEFMDRSDAIWERLRIAEFPRQVPIEKRDPDLARRIIEEELPGVMALAVNGLADVFARGHVIDTDRGIDLKTELRRMGDHEAAFLEEVGYVSGIGDIASQPVFLEYQIWAENNGYRPLGQGKFSTRVRDILRCSIETPKDENRKTIRVFRGIRKL